MLPLPFPYVVPGGRFDEIYYWDSYFIMLGLEQSGRRDLAVDELVEMGSVDEKKAAELIMDARKHWFAEEAKV